MRQNMVHFVASDAHDTEWRPPDMRGARQIRVVGIRRSTWPSACSCTHPRMTLTGEYIECEDPEDVEEAKPWYRFW